MKYLTAQISPVVKNHVFSYMKNKGEGQSACLHRLISAFDISCQDSLITLVPISGICSHQLASVAEVLNILVCAFADRKPQAGFLVSGLILCMPSR